MTRRTILYGWRCWFAFPEGRIASTINHNIVWPERQTMIAGCTDAFPSSLHTSPSKVCACGIYAFKTLEDARRYFQSLYIPPEYFLHHRHLITGRVALWGRVIEHERGYRAQYAYPETLLAHDDNDPDTIPIQRASQRYGVPVILIPKELRGLIPEDEEMHKSPRGTNA